MEGDPSDTQIQYFFQKNLTRNAFLGIIIDVGWGEQRETQHPTKLQSFFEEKFDTNTTNVV